MADLIPRCPSCNVRGIEFVQTESKEQFTLVYCGKCGAIHGALPGSAAAVPAKPTRLSERVSQTLATPPPAPPVNLETEDAPLCPQHYVVMERKTVPPGQKNAGQPIWVCPRFTECHQWRKIETPAPLLGEPLAKLPATVMDQTEPADKDQV